MSVDYFSDEHFSQANYSGKIFTTGEYESCSFTNIDFSSQDLSSSRFLETEFKDCNFSNANLADVSLQAVSFFNCKLLGIQFVDCRAFNFSVRFENCILDLSSFYKMKLNKTIFSGSRLHGVDFTEADLTGSKLDNCDLLNTVFDQTNVEKADFRHAVNYSIDPESNKIKAAIFSMPEVTGLLDKYKIKIENS